MKKAILLAIIIATAFVINFSYGLEELIVKTNENFSFCQTCYDASYIIFSGFKDPYGAYIPLNINMTNLGNGVFCVDFQTTKEGEYHFYGVSDGCEKSFLVKVTSTNDWKTKKGVDYVVLITIFYLGLLFLFNRFLKESLEGFLGIILTGVYVLVIQTNSLIDFFSFILAGFFIVFYIEKILNG